MWLYHLADFNLYKKKYPVSCKLKKKTNIYFRGYCGHDRMVVGFPITYAISAYHH